LTSSARVCKLGESPRRHVDTRILIIEDEQDVIDLLTLNFRKGWVHT
jgi:hypothetical protein